MRRLALFSVYEQEALVNKGFSSRNVRQNFSCKFIQKTLHFVLTANETKTAENPKRKTGPNPSFSSTWYVKTGSSALVQLTLTIEKCALMSRLLLGCSTWTERIHDTRHVHVMTRVRAHYGVCVWRERFTTRNALVRNLSPWLTYRLICAAEKSIHNSDFFTLRGRSCCCIILLEDIKLRCTTLEAAFPAAHWEKRCFPGNSMEMFAAWCCCCNALHCKLCFMNLQPKRLIWSYSLLQPWCCCAAQVSTDTCIGNSVKCPPPPPPWAKRERKKERKEEDFWRWPSPANPGGPEGLGPPCPQDLFQNHAVFRQFWGENPYFEQILGSGG